MTPSRTILRQAARSIDAARRARWVAGSCAAFVALAILAWPAVAPAGLISAGSDLFRTPGNGSTYQDFPTSSPLPANFFGPGSDPFIGRIYLTGLALTPPLGPTDTVVERKAAASTSCGGPPATIPIEIVALSLVSVQPITVTYNGGLNPEQWNVKVALSSIAPAQPTGSMVVRQLSANGGTFSATLPVQPRLVFTRSIPPAEVVLDGLAPIQFQSSGYWVHSADPVLGICNGPPGTVVDHDANPETPSRPIQGSSLNFTAGLLSMPQSCIGAQQGQGKTLTQEQSQLAKHGVLPPQCVIPPHEGAAFIGDKCFITTPTMAAAMLATYVGDGSTCLGDLNGDGRDDGLPPRSPSVPGVAPWGLVAIMALLMVSAAAILSGARRRSQRGA